MNGCRDITYGEGPLKFALLLRSQYPTLRQHGNSLRVQLQFNWTTVAEELGQNKTSSISSVNVSNSDWLGGTRISLDINRSQAVPVDMATRIRRKDQRYRVRVRVVLNGTVASDWSPECESPMFHTCLSTYNYTLSTLHV